MNVLYVAVVSYVLLEQYDADCVLYSYENVKWKMKNEKWKMQIE